MTPLRLLTSRVGDSARTQHKAATRAQAATRLSPAILIDGGMGHHLKRLGVKIEGKVGSLERFLGVCAANTTDPELVVQAHVDFIDAGADAITTNSYSVIPSVLALLGEPRDRLAEHLLAACAVANDARGRRRAHGVKLLGCLPPLAESYRPDKVGGFEANLEDYRLIAQTIAPHCDVLLCETMSSAAEAKAACTAAAETGLPVRVRVMLGSGLEFGLGLGLGLVGVGFVDVGRRPASASER
eukprot:TRINITY_DN8553_c0_g1_i1.p1 TRINITY_DN8553_c0_g1~~TRINITY_DN8553_c0_g1_i1.p1  ORF type:complete len:242 (+),score=38.52 TRINITY_DN8553_c0_g1_i1:213-938(+)